MTLMTRREYNDATAANLRLILSFEAAERALACQYPKSHDEAARECRFRGADVDALPATQAWSAEEVDQIVRSADLAGWLTPEAFAARARGMTLVQWRAACGDPFPPVDGARWPTIATGGQEVAHDE